MQETFNASPNSGRFEFQNWSVYQKAFQSVPLNIAEGCSRWSKKDKANFWRVAKGSVFECSAILDLVERLKLAETNFDSLQESLVHLGKMLSALIRFIEKEGR